MLIELDDRRRVSLGRLGRPEHRRYFATEESDGTIVLIPAVVMTETEARILANPVLMAQIERTMTDPSTRRTRVRRMGED
jgi:hypothetical protein